MEVMVLFLLLLAMPGGSGAAWCTCRPDASDPALQKTIDYACGAGADCNPILQNGLCYNPNTVLAHCSYAANSYYQRNNQVQGACDFTGTATVTPTDPSSNGCIYPATSRDKQCFWNSNLHSEPSLILYSKQLKSNPNWNRSLGRSWSFRNQHKYRWQCCCWFPLKSNCPSSLTHNIVIIWLGFSSKELTEIEDKILFKIYLKIIRIILRFM
ncbi:PLASMODESMATA CALLOSE-BINDING PROTEIN 3 isoform X1 [Dendrobium catenatum]|uniref:PLASMODESMATA CALLOSE-BINDING PROTEIN 3 isoform X1 n=1 Tax=Dendrobium catenatum TaxID=906689 RepID=UPI0009F2AD4A|nr:PLASMODESMATA CALLOSE-BINDING PROTEIN 3 isoform X1 [Dendrobium catenatum]